jgi:glycosyltransferase involved in cell wall biosynthesis
MSKVSILIPARRESNENIAKTLNSIYKNATGEFEVILGLDGAIEDGTWPDFSKLMDIKVIEFPEVVGIKTNINAMAAMATGKYLYKSDAHCSFGKGFDEILQADMEEDWIVMPRFYVLNGETWEWQDDRFYDYFYLCCPFTDPKGFRFKAGGHWPERTAERKPLPMELRKDAVVNLIHLLDVDETPQIHGSGWFMTKDRFFELGGFPNIDPYGHAQEPIWLGLKNWLMGGKVMVNKKTWYAHLHQQGNKRGYHMDRQQEQQSYKLAAEHFVGDKGHYLHNFEWFVDKFMPMPGWPENWKEILREYQQNT